jgi:hypothetical protein
MFRRGANLRMFLKVVKKPLGYGEFLSAFFSPLRDVYITLGGIADYPQWKKL